jgi:hypothetical protein
VWITFKKIFGAENFFHYSLSRVTRLVLLKVGSLQPLVTLIVARTFFSITHMLLAHLGRLRSYYPARTHGIQAPQHMGHSLPAECTMGEPTGRRRVASPQEGCDINGKEESKKEGKEGWQEEAEVTAFPSLF